MRKLMLVMPGVLLMACHAGDLKKVDVNQESQFSGRLQYDMFYGAPGFGEDTTMDEEEPAYILHLDQPFLFRDTMLAADAGVDINTCGYDTVNTIQVRFDAESNINGPNLKQMAGKKVVIACTLYGAHTGHHHAPALTEKVLSIREQ